MYDMICRRVRDVSCKLYMCECEHACGNVECVFLIDLSCDTSLEHMLSML